jgi:Domain of unknown function (DUF4193)
MDDNIDEQSPDDDLDDADVSEDLESEPLDEDDLDEDDDDVGEDVLEDEGGDDEEGAGDQPLTAVAPQEAGSTDEAEELAEAEESEAGLDEILRERLRPGEVAEYDGEVEGERQAAKPEVEVSPRRANEFVCRSCFLVKSRNQLADPDRLLCTDCVGSS